MYSKYTGHTVLFTPFHQNVQQITGRMVILFVCVTFPFSQLFLQHLILYNNQANEIFLAKNCRHFHFGAFLGTFNAW